MSDNSPIITVRGLSKSYFIRHKGLANAHPTLRDDIVRVLRAPLRLMDAAGGLVKEKFWALKDVDIDIYPGEVVALMGVNGSGKSTLLKILSRITQPEEGEAVLKGQATSLLEVGTGFHEELTGRENVYFNGSILGMSKSEIDEKFNEIVKFSEVEEFLDTPVKFYSSGMRVRLAFSIAAHLRPDILLIDEVLAVGDVRFKQKSIKRMKEIAESGTTIVFVSHIVGHIRQICTRGVVLDKGRLVFDGDLEDGIDTYLKLNRMDEADSKAAQNEESSETRQEDIESGAIKAEVVDIEVTKSKYAPSISIDLKIENLDGNSHEKLWVGMIVKDIFDKSVSPINNSFGNMNIGLSEKDKSNTYRIKIDNANFAPGQYSLSIAVKDIAFKETLYKKKNIAEFEIPNYSLSHVDASTVRKNTFNVLVDYVYEVIGNEKRS